MLTRALAEDMPLSRPNIYNHYNAYECNNIKKKSLKFPASRQLSRLSPSSNHLFLEPMSSFSENFIKSIHDVWSYFANKKTNKWMPPKINLLGRGSRDRNLTFARNLKFATSKTLVNSMKKIMLCLKLGIFQL